MNTRQLIRSGLTALATVALTAAWAHGQEILAPSNSGGTGFNAGYNDGDLILAFFSAGDGAKNGNVLFDLGSASSFTGLAGGTYSVTGFNGSATAGQPTVGFGSAELTANEMVPSPNTFWTIMGSNTVTKQLWLTGTTNQSQQSASTQSTTGNEINGIGSAGVGGANSDGSGFDGSQTAGNYLAPTGGRWQNFSGFAAIQVSGTSNSMALFSLLPGVSGGGSSTHLGYFVLTDTAGVFSLSYTDLAGPPPTNMPEPSTGAAIISAAALAFAVIRRKQMAT